jgi:hypothetical protein
MEIMKLQRIIEEADQGYFTSIPILINLILDIINIFEYISKYFLNIFFFLYRVKSSEE